MKLAREHGATVLGWLLVPACVVSFACGAYGSSKDDSTADPSFECWREQHLCDWQTVQGEIEKTPTWHERDLGVSFLQTPTEISQLLESDTGGAPCLLFDTIADVAPEALMSLVLDFNDDGSPEIEQQISALRWKSVPFLLRAPDNYDRVRLSVIKRGSGHAVLAQMRVVPQSNCGGQALRRARDDTSLTPSASSE
jgi:hypothetical protein